MREWVRKYELALLRVFISPCIQLEGLNRFNGGGGRGGGAINSINFWVWACVLLKPWTLKLIQDLDQLHFVLLYCPPLGARDFSCAGSGFSTEGSQHTSFQPQFGKNELALILLLFGEDQRCRLWIWWISSLVKLVLPWWLCGISFVRCTVSVKIPFVSPCTDIIQVRMPLMLSPMIKTL